MRCTHRAGIPVFRDTTFLAAGPASERSRSTTQEGLRVALVEVGGCIFDAGQIPLSHGFEGLDPVGREAFVNHLHLTADDRIAAADQIIHSWAAEMRSRWPGRTFRIYRQADEGVVTIRFHLVRPGLPNWCEDGIEVIVVRRQKAEPTLHLTGRASTV